MKTNQVTVRIPATTANLGPGYDCIGMALDWWNEISIKVSDRPNVSIIGEGSSDLSLTEDNLVYRSARELLKRVKEEFSCERVWWIRNNPVHWFVPIKEVSSLRNFTPFCCWH